MAVGGLLWSNFLFYLQEASRSAMLQRLKDAIAFHSEFGRWEQYSDFPTMLTGNRIAEMHGQSPSYGQDIDIERLRLIRRNIGDRVLLRSKLQGISSRQGVVQLICEIGDVYISEMNLHEPPKRILFCLRLLAPAYTEFRDFLPPRWKEWVVAGEQEESRQREELNAFLPELRRARHEAQFQILGILSSLAQREAPSSIFAVWAAISDKVQETERQIAVRSALSLLDVVACIEVFRQSGVVTVIGTALPEPRFWKTPQSTLDEASRATRFYLDRVSK